METLQHSSTPRVIEHNTSSYRDLSVNLYVVFEFIDGPTLSEDVTEHGQLCLDDALQVVAGILNVLETFHNDGVGHRDIKPDNIILRNGTCSSPVLIELAGLRTNDFPTTTRTGQEYQSQIRKLYKSCTKTS